MKDVSEKLFGGVFRGSSLARENDRLAYELSRLTIDRAKILSLEKENALLKKEFGFKNKNVSSSILARVIGKNTLDDSEALIIDRGKNDGVALGEAAVYADGIFVGKVVKVYDHYSLILLAIDGKMSVAVTSLNSARTNGIVRGEHGLSMIMDLIPQDENIAPGDSVVTSGLEPGIPRNLLLGEVEAVAKEARSPFQAATLKSPVDFSNLDYLLIVGDE